MTKRQRDLKRFYAILDGLAARIGGARLLAECHGRMLWPRRGIYFFHENGERRTDSGAGGRIVRVGTHALHANAKTKLWHRLRAHRGARAKLKGNHRGSIFRGLVGNALMKRDNICCSTWQVDSSASAHVRAAELPLEKRVSQTIGAMSFLWLEVDDPPNAHKQRARIERNAIALLSNYAKPHLDVQSPGWLGRHCAGEKVRESGLWNQMHVDAEYDPDFLDQLAKLAEKMRR